MRYVRSARFVQFRASKARPPRRRRRYTVRGRSPLGELERATRLGAAVLLAFDDARVAGQITAAFEHGPQIRLVTHQRLGDAMSHRAGLPGKSATRNRADHVVLVLAVDGDERLLDQHAQHRPREERLYGL